MHIIQMSYIVVFIKLSPLKTYFSVGSPDATMLSQVASPLPTSHPPALCGIHKNYVYYLLPTESLNRSHDVIGELLGDIGSIKEDRTQLLHNSY